MNIPIEFISSHPGEAWIVGDKGEVVSFITNLGIAVQVIIVLERNGQFVTSLLHHFKRV